jgi:alpha-galactosidase
MSLECTVWTDAREWHDGLVGVQIGIDFVMQNLTRILGLLMLLWVLEPVGLPASNAQIANLLTAPPMGWNSWNAFGCNIDENKILTQAKAMVTSGMLELGYKFVVMDDCWSKKTRAANGNLEADPQKFPHGIKALSDAIHALGLKFGMYSDRGAKTCGGFPGSQDFELQDAKQFAAWGVDYLKYDNCNAVLDEKTQYQTMQAALKAQPRDIVFSVCSWWFRPFIPAIGDLWRTTWDIRDVWDSKAIASSIDEQSVMSISDTNNLYASYARLGHYNDPDMLMVGNYGRGGLGGPGMNDLEYRSHFGLWAIMSAPLMTGNQLAIMNAATLETLTNSEVIALNQDPADTPAHTQGVRLRRNGNAEVWAKSLSSGAIAVLMLNRSDQSKDLRVQWSDLGLLEAGVNVRDLWQRKDLGVFDAGFMARAVPAHGSVMLLVRGKKLEPEVFKTVSLEAESKSNTLIEPANIQACKTCSGRAYVSNIRGEGSLMFNKVFVSRTGSVPITVYFTNPSEQKLLKVTTSAGANIVVRVHSSGDTDQVASLRLNLELLAGENTITFSLPGSKAPSIDRIVYQTGTK